MKSLPDLVNEFVAALDHALHLQAYVRPHSFERYGTSQQIIRAWATYRDVRAELHMRLDAIRRAEQIRTDMVMDNNLIADQADMAYEAMGLAAQPDED